MCEDRIYPSLTLGFHPKRQMRYVSVLLISVDILEEGETAGLGRYGIFRPWSLPVMMVLSGSSGGKYMNVIIIGLEWRNRLCCKYFLQF